VPGIANATITLQSSTDNATWSNVGTNVTSATSTYTFNQSEPTLNTYYFRTIYAGNTTWGNATSNVVAVAVNTVGTTNLTAVATPEIAPVNVNFTINGTLNDTSGTPITGALITLENHNTSAPIATTTTDANGNYAFSLNESTLGTYYYNTAYAGYNNGAIASSTSNVVNVTVTNVTTQLTAAANVSTSNTNTNFTISGTLSTTNGTTPGPIANATIIFETSPGGAYIATTTTDANGNYTFNESEPSPSTYHYLTTYAGNTTDFYANATSPVVTVQVGLPTTLTAAANVTNVTVNTPFTISGTLSTTSGGLAGQSIALQSNSTGNWTTVNTTTTASNGNYSFSVSESANGTYQYQTTYAGTSSILPATSNVVTVNVTSGGPTTTTLTATANVSTTTVGTPFTISGTLSTPSGGIAGATITLNGTNTMTDSNGTYSFSLSEPTVGTYQFQTTYAGNATYGNATSNTASVTVTVPVITPISSPAATGNYLFVAGNASALWYKTWDGTTWSNATSLGGVLAAGSGPAATSSGGTTYVFVTGTDNAVWYKTSTGGTSGGWSGWHSLGGVLAAGSSPAGTSGSSAIDVFAHGTDNAVWYKNTTGGWHSLGGVLAAGSGPAATSSGGVAYVFAQGTNGAVYVKTTTSGWTSLGGVLAPGSSPAATSSTGVIDVFALGTDSTVWQTTTTSSGVWTSTGPW
jgi:hypothetical protein